MTNYEIREKARQSLGGKIFGARWMSALAIMLLYSLIIGACSAIPYVGQVGAFLIAGPFALGIAGYFIKLSRSAEEPSINNLFDGFSDFSGSLMIYLMIQVFVTLWLLLFIIPGYIKAYAFSMAYFVKRDNPTYTWKQCLDESQRLMKGNKWRLFCLDLSFLGWIIVGLLCFGIGILWVNPYMQAAHAAFYDSITDRTFAEETETASAFSSTDTFTSL